MTLDAVYERSLHGLVMLMRLGQRTGQDEALDDSILSFPVILSILSEYKALISRTAVITLVYHEPANLAFFIYAVNKTFNLAAPTKKDPRTTG